MISESQMVSTSSAIAATASSRSAGSRVAVLDPVELTGDRVELLEDGPPPGLARVRGEDQADQGTLQVLGDLRGVDPPLADLPQRGLGRLRHGHAGAIGRAIGRALAEGPDAGLLLGQVDQVEIHAERPDQGPQRRQLEPAEAVTEPPRLLHRGAARNLFASPRISSSRRYASSPSIRRTTWLSISSSR